MQSNKVVSINSGGRVSEDESDIVMRMEEAQISVHAQDESLPGLGLEEVREYIVNHRWESVGGLVFAVTSLRERHRMGRIAFHTFGKELVLSGQSVFATDLTTILSALERAAATDDDPWLDNYGHLLVANFHRGGEACPINPGSVQLVTDYLYKRHDRGVQTHVQVSGCRQGQPPNLSDWYGSSFWNWFQEQQTIVQY